MELDKRIKDLFSKLDLIERCHLQEASSSLSRRYREGNYGEKDLAYNEKLAYILARLPATKASITKVLNELNERMLFNPKSMADIGAGPGTAAWTSSLLWPSLKEFALLERDAAWIKLGKILQEPYDRLNKSSWYHNDITKDLEFDAADLVIAAYSFQEIAQSLYEKILKELLLRTNEVLVVIEPGTPRGFSNINVIRKLLIEQGSHILAPCTHNNPCPIKDDDWCHFSSRLSRNYEHRYIKNAELAYEDEKFSFIIATKKAHTPPQARVIKPLLKRSGHVIIDTCDAQGLKRQTVSRSNKHYKSTKDLNWGQAVTFDL